MELPGKNDGNDSAANKKEQQSKQSLGNPSIDTGAAASANTTEVSVSSVEGSSIGLDRTFPSILTSGKRDHNGTFDTITATGMGIIGGRNYNRAKRGKREWLSPRGSRQTRVGKDFQVASLPPVGGPVGGSPQIEKTNNNGNGK